MSESENKPTNVFDGLGEAVAQIGTEDIAKEAVRQICAEIRQLVVEQKRQADATEHIVKLLKPWAEREKRKNLVEQDPDYLEAAIRQVQLSRKTRKKPAKGKRK